MSSKIDEKTSSLREDSGHTYTVAVVHVLLASRKLIDPKPRKPQLSNETNPSTIGSAAQATLPAGGDVRMRIRSLDQEAWMDGKYNIAAGGGELP